MGGGGSCTSNVRRRLFVSEGRIPATTPEKLGVHGEGRACSNPYKREKEARKRKDLLPCLGKGDFGETRKTRKESRKKTCRKANCSDIYIEKAQKR